MSIPIVIFGTQTAIFSLQKHKFSIKSKILFGYPIFMLTFAAQTTSLTINFQIKQHYATSVSKQLQTKSIFGCSG